MKLTNVEIMVSGIAILAMVAMMVNAKHSGSKIRIYYDFSVTWNPTIEQKMQTGTFDLGGVKKIPES